MRKRQLFINCFPLYLSRRIIAFELRGSGFVKVLLGTQAYHILASLLLTDFTMEQFIRGCNAQYEDYFVSRNMLPRIPLFSDIHLAKPNSTRHFSFILQVGVKSYYFTSYL